MRGHEPVNILLVDDQPAKLLSYEVILSELGENLIKAGSAKEALEQILKTEIAVVLVDVCMPDLDGFELAAMIREHPRFEKTAIIFVSAVHLTDVDRLRGYKSGAVDYIPVPVVPELLRAKVKVFAELYRKTRQLEQLNAELEQRVVQRTTALAENKQQLKFVADHAPVLLAQCDSQRRYKFVNQPYGDFFGCRPADIVGRHAREVLGEQAYAHAAPYMEEALAGHRTEFDLELPNTSHGLRAVQVAYAPEFDASGRAVGWVAAILDITERKQAEAKLARTAAIVESSDDAIISKTLEGRITSWNSGAARIFGYNANEMIGQLITRIIPPELHGEEEQILARLKRGERIEHFETARIAKDGHRIDISLTISPVRNTAGKVIGASKVARDISERKRAEEHIHRIMKELSHRTKNLMAVVQAISWQTAQKSRDLEDFEQRFTQRIEALARSHDLLVKRDWRGVVIEDLVRAQLEPFLDSAKERLVAHGPTLLLMPAAAQDLGLALHELSTNASKYGALSVPTGNIEIGWTILCGAADAKRFQMTWRESGGPMVSPPVHKGFGTTVITATVSTTFNGNAELAYRPEGVCWALTAPIGHLFTEPPEPGACMRGSA